MAFINVKDREGRMHRIEARPGQSVMEAIRDAGLPIEAQCGGCASCATCHVYVDDPWLAKLEPQSDVEIDMLDLTDEVQDNSRLSCQIPFGEDLDGMSVELPPE